MLFHLSVPILWLGAFAAARLLEHAPHASLWFPPAAVTFAAVIVGGRRVLPSIIVACAIATYSADRMYGVGTSVQGLVLSSAAFALAHALGHAGAAALLRRREGATREGPTIGAVLAFLLFAAAGAAIAAVVGAVLLAWTGLVQGPVSPELVVAWWLGDYTAVVTLTPAAVALLRWIGGPVRAGAPPWLAAHPRAPLPAAPGPKLVLFVGATLGVLALARIFEEQSVLLALLMLPIVLQLWITYTSPRGYTVASVTAFSLLTVGAASLSAGGATLVLQCAALSLAANAYLGLAVPGLVADNTRLREQLARDRLTGAMSRACYEDRAAEAVARAAATGGAFSLVLLDLDGLKAVNDRDGHLAGDALLVAVVERCRSCLGAQDSIARLGGDEFVVLLPGRDAQAAQAIVARMQRTLGALRAGEGSLPVSASFGLATWAGGDTAETLLARADGAMYIHKRASRAARRSAPTLQH